MTASRVTTRAGREIRRVAKYHVVDVSTGTEWVQIGDGWSPRCPCWLRVVTLDRALRVTARAEAACALVRVLVAIAAEAP